MRFAAYAGTSVVLAAGTIVRAFFQRANFYSASVQISQSNASLMILTNVALLGTSMIMLGLQRLFYGPLRPIEVEQLYEKAWFAITETCLAMTIFRDEVGGWFLVMFVALLIGKVWGWIGEGRVEILEQQPPANPRWFHAQLSLSLLISAAFDSFMLQYAVNTVLQNARPNMMVMFAFEFAVLTVSSLSTAARYGISVYELRVVKNQVKERREQIRSERERARTERAQSEESSTGENAAVATTSDDDIDTMEIDTPGWEDKGRWIFYLDLMTDFFKLVLYMTFFCVLCMFHGMPIHIIRDVALTIRSFYKRITDFVRYRQATRDMNAKYPDATAEEVAREDVCIICREDIRPWPQQVTQEAQDGQQAANEPDRPPSTTGPRDERLRPKKLPCGHILHFACLRSWLERQQICPTCRRPVLVPDANTRTQGTQAALHPQVRLNAQVNGGQGQPPAQPAPQQNVYQFGPLRVAFGVRHRAPGPNAPIVAGANNQQAAAPGSGPRSRTRGFFNRQSNPTRTVANFSSPNVSAQLQQLEAQISRDIQNLRVQTEQLNLVRALQGELLRLRTLESQPWPFNPSANTQAAPAGQAGSNAQAVQPTGISFAAAQPIQSGANSNPQLPPGVVLPEGWTLLPLRQISSGADAVDVQNAISNTQSIPTQPTSSLPNPSHSHTTTEANAGTSNVRGPAASQSPPDPSTVVSTSRPSPSPSASNGTAILPASNAEASHGTDSLTNGSQWSFGALPSEREAPSASTGRPNAKLRAEAGVSGEAATTAESSTEQGEKGKGRAATVEDGTDGGDDN